MDFVESLFKQKFQTKSFDGTQLSNNQIFQKLGQ